MPLRLAVLWLCFGCGLAAQQTALQPAAGTQAALRSALAQRIDQLMQRPAAQRAFWGIEAVDLADGSLVYGYNGHKLFVPASNAKLYATSLALDRLEPGKRFATRLVADTALDARGILKGDLRLIGGGDPNFSSRVVPYDKQAEYRSDRLEPIREIARQAWEAGLRRVEGGLIGDDRRYVWDPYPSGWSLDDATWSYGAPVSALSFNDNTVEILVRPGRSPGSPARLGVKPELDYFKIRNLTRTGAGRTVSKRLSLDVDAGLREVEIWGGISIRSPGRELKIAVDDPALFAATALKAELEALGVEFEGQARAEHLESAVVPDLKAGPSLEEPVYRLILAELTSAPLEQVVQIVNKESQNLHAEMLLREVGYARRGVGSVEAGIEELRDFLKEAGLSPWEFFLSDAAGLSRRNLVSPAGTVKLLGHMWTSPHREALTASLAIAGEDGTLDWRFSKSSARGLVRAKTGTLSHVTALAGYARTLDGRDLAFAVYVNNFGVSTSYVRNIVDRIVVELVRGSRQAPSGGSD